MAKVDQEARIGSRLPSVRKALPEGQRQSPETQVLPDQPRITRLDPSTRDLLRWEVGVNTSIHEPQKEAGGEKKAFDSLRQKEPTALPTVAGRKKPDDLAKAEVSLLPSVLPTPQKKDIVPFTGVTTLVTRNQLLPQKEGQPQKDVGTSLIRRPLNAIQVQRGNREVALYTGNLPEPRQDQPTDRQVSLYDPGNLVVLRPDVWSLTEKTNKRDKLSRAEEIVLNAIRSRADEDGKNAKVAYKALAAMTHYTARHVKRVVKSLIRERGLVRVDKRTLRPRHNAINVYHVDMHRPQEGSSTDRGISLLTRKIGVKQARPDSLTTRVTEHVTPNIQPTRLPLLRPDRLIPEPKFEGKSIAEKAEAA